jgi:hypothetical protein
MSLRGPGSGKCSRGDQWMLPQPQLPTGRRWNLASSWDPSRRRLPCHQGGTESTAGVSQARNA